VFEVVNRDTGGSGKYEFSPSEMTFKVGETVSFRVSAETEFHTFNVDDLGIDQAIDGGQSVEFTHTFDKAGTFKLVCLVHEASGMVGTITVQ
jgi:plastocyanin